MDTKLMNILKNVMRKYSIVISMFIQKLVMER